MATQHYVGLDIASESFTAAIGTAPWQLLTAPQEFTNNPDGFQALQTWLEVQDVTSESAVVCMEATGVYGEALAYFLASQEYWLAMEPPLKVKRAFAPVGHKNDARDSAQIAEYAFRFADELRRWQPKNELLEQVAVLLTVREQLTRQKTAHRNALRALKRKTVRTPLAEQLHQENIRHLQSQRDTIDREIKHLFDQDPDLHHNLVLLLTIPGVGLLLAAHTLVLLATLEHALNPKSLAAYVGICPYENRSGSSVFHKPRSRHFGPAAIRKLLYLAAMSVRTHQAPFRKYFMRKVAEGKSKQLVLNNIANKLIKIMCAVLREQQPYIPTFRSVNPALTIGT